MKVSVSSGFHICNSELHLFILEENLDLSKPQDKIH